MYEFYNLKKIKRILIFSNFIKYSAWFLFLYFQGKAIEQAIDKNILLEQLLYTIFWFAVTKIVLMLADINNKFCISYYENKEVSYHWNMNFPNRLYHDNENKNNLIYLKYFDYLPNLFNLGCLIKNNQCTIVLVSTIVIFLMLYTGFYYGILGLSAIFLLNFLSKNICLKKLEKYHQAINEDKANTLGWINQYFKSYREISFNWQEQINPWIKANYNNLYQSKKKLIFTQLARDMLSQIAIEIPFIINTLVVIVCVFFNYLSITQMFVWVGLSQFVIQASNAFLENKVNFDKKNTLDKKLKDIDVIFKDQKYLKVNALEIVQKTTITNLDTVYIKLQDNTVNKISLKPGIYHIQGTNGSGKSTLLNSVIKYEREVAINNYYLLNLMLKDVSNKNIRIIERDPIIFNNLHSFKEQILGPKCTNFAWQSILQKNLQEHLTPAVLQKLINILILVENNFNTRSNKQLSSGEKILISLMRALTSWNNKISILIIDECSMFLDIKIKDLFLKCISEISKNTAVYITSHEKINFKMPVNQF